MEFFLGLYTYRPLIPFIFYSGKLHTRLVVLEPITLPSTPLLWEKEVPV